VRLCSQYTAVHDLDGVNTVHTAWASDEATAQGDEEKRVSGQVSILIPPPIYTPRPLLPLEVASLALIAHLSRSIPLSLSPSHLASPSTMSEDRKSRWDAPSDAPAASTSSSTPAQKPDEAAAAAAAIAAKITASMRGPSGAIGNELIRLMPGEEGYTKDIPINDLKNRYVLTKGSTQKQVNLCSSPLVSQPSPRYWAALGRLIPF
jgi:hypothetical protein